MAGQSRARLLLIFLTAWVPIAYGSDAELVKVNFFGEALCPYCARFIDSTAWTLFNNGVMNLTTFRYIPWGNAHFIEEGATCQHGPAECDLNRILSCAMHLYPGQNAWFPFVKCLESRAPGKKQPFTDVAPCANETGLDLPAIMNCASGQLGDQLQRQAANETARLRPAHSFVPWITVDGIPIGGAYEQLQTFICADYKGQRPQACFGPPQTKTTSATYTNLKQILLQLGKQQHAHKEK